MFAIKKAQAEHQQPIKALIRATRLNPIGIDYRRFVVVTDATDAFVGCGQVKGHRDGSRELASIAVVRGWRRRSVARIIINQLLQEHPRPLWLTCASPMVPFYEPFGFCEMTDATQMPAYFRRVYRLTQFWTRLSQRQLYLAVMVCEENSLRESE